MKILLGLVAVLSLHAEILSISLTVSGMDCASCVTGLETKLKRLRGIQSVELKPAQNLLTLQLLEGNSIRLDRIRDEIKGVGFTPKEAVIVVRGRLEQRPGGPQGLWSLALESSNQTFLLSPLEPAIARKLESGKVI